MTNHSPPTDTHIIARIRELARIAWPNWCRGHAVPCVQPRPIQFSAASGGAELQSILLLEGRRTIALAGRRLGDAELLEVRQREALVDLVARKPPHLQEALDWLSDVATATDMLSKRRANYAAQLVASGFDRIERVADQLFLHVLPWLMEKPEADTKALTARVRSCRPEVRAMSDRADGEVPCPFSDRPVHKTYEARMAANRARWQKRARSAPRGSYGPKAGSLNAARIAIRAKADAAPPHLTIASGRCESSQ